MAPLSNVIAFDAQQTTLDQRGFWSMIGFTVGITACFACLILAVLVTCACCPRVKKSRRNSPPYLPSASVKTPTPTEGGDVKEGKEDQKSLKLPAAEQSSIQEKETLAPMTAAPMTVITPEPNPMGKKLSKVNPSEMKPIHVYKDAARFDDPAYRTIGPGLDDIFADSRSARPLSVDSGKEKTSKKGHVVHKKQKAPIKPMPTKSPKSISVKA